MLKVVKIILVNPENKILLQLRDNKPSIPAPDYWDFIGGGIEENESMIDAIKREVKEEINFKLDWAKLVGQVNVKKGTLSLSQDAENFIFIGKINVPLEELELSEGQRLGYFNLEEMDKIKLIPDWREFLKNNRLTLGI